MESVMPYILRAVYRCSWLFVMLGVCNPCRPASLAAERPNILWITSEDNSPYLGCYGDRQAHTPNIDRLASQGIRYRHAFANAPVCSTARTTLITGMHATSLGAHHHRSSMAIPQRFRLYPQHLRTAGYYCTNNVKTDYNLADNRQVWDESSSQAHYKHRQPGQPFFAVFNLTASHESQVAPKSSNAQFRLSPDEIQLPPYHPDTPEIRRDWANYYDQVTQMDEQVGELLAELEQLRLAEETIVFYYSDHGGGLPRGKRNIHDSGTRVPLVIRFPSRWKQLSPAEAGEWVDDVVSFVDLPATVFSLCDVPIPSNFEGVPFLGKQPARSRELAFLYRGRMDERYDHLRAVRDARFRYVRNYSPHRPWGQHYAYPFRVLPSMRSWFEEYQAGRCNEVQAAYWQSKPSEEFYDTVSDSFEIDNLVADPQHVDNLNRLRHGLRREILITRDTGFIPEGMYARLAGERTVYDYAQSQAYPLERILDVAEKASDGVTTNLPELLSALADEHPVIRYWGATGCLILGARAVEARSSLLAALDDDWYDVRVVAAEAVAMLGEQTSALATLEYVLKKGNQYEVLAAQNALDFMWKAGNISLSQAQDIVQDGGHAEPNDRIPDYLRSRP
jgi:N-sulfoglucosamine sulfohydrolase